MKSFWAIAHVKRVLESNISETISASIIRVNAMSYMTALPLLDKDMQL
jgi:hypothetical protein